MYIFGIFGLIFGMSPLGGVFFSNAVFSSWIWWLALSIDLTSFVIALINPCCVLFSSVSVLVKLDVLSWNSSGLSMTWCHSVALFTFAGSCVTSLGLEWQLAFVLFQVSSLNFYGVYPLFRGLFDLGLDLLDAEEGWSWGSVINLPKQSCLGCFFISVSIMADP